MALVQLLGRGTYGPVAPYGPGVSRLWLYFLPPPAQNSIVIYDDGSVVEGVGFENDRIEASNVYMFILGGTNFTCEEGSFEYNALTAAGYTWRPANTLNAYYETDSYDTQY